MAIRARRPSFVNEIANHVKALLGKSRALRTGIPTMTCAVIDDVRKVLSGTQPLSNSAEVTPLPRAYPYPRR
jgi:hypothetical protein